MICDLYPSSTQADVKNEFKRYLRRDCFSQRDVLSEREKIQTFCNE
jgi:hypothetical protein